jgi:ribosomal protein S18 acetylase RimI-like enzyme
MSVTVRPASPTEFEAIGKLTLAAYERDGQLAENGYAAALADVAGRAKTAEVFAAVDEDGEVLGAVTFVLPGTPLAELSQAGQAEFRMLAVAPQAWGRGIGALLAQACVDRARELDASAVVICTRDFATTAQAMYDKLGFVRVPERDWVPVPGVNLLVLQLDLRG